MEEPVAPLLKKWERIVAQRKDIYPLIDLTEEETPPIKDLTSKNPTFEQHLKNILRSYTPKDINIEIKDPTEDPRTAAEYDTINRKITVFSHVSPSPLLYNYYLHELMHSLQKSKEASHPWLDEVDAQLKTLKQYLNNNSWKSTTVILRDYSILPRIKRSYLTPLKMLKSSGDLLNALHTFAKTTRKRAPDKKVANKLIHEFMDNILLHHVYWYAPLYLYVQGKEVKDLKPDDWKNARKAHATYLLNHFPIIQEIEKRRRKLYHSKNFHEARPLIEDGGKKIINTAINKDLPVLPSVKRYIKDVYRTLGGRLESPLDKEELGKALNDVKYRLVKYAMDRISQE